MAQEGLLHVPHSPQVGQQGFTVGMARMAPRELIWEVTRLAAKSWNESGFPAAHRGGGHHSQDPGGGLLASHWCRHRKPDCCGSTVPVGSVCGF